MNNVRNSAMSTDNEAGCMMALVEQAPIRYLFDTVDKHVLPARSRTIVQFLSAKVKASYVFL